MDQSAQRIFIRSIGINRIEPGNPEPTEGALSFFIERRGVEKRSLAGGAEEFSREGLGLCEAGSAHRYS
jgi:hypothetical protein